MLTGAMIAVATARRLSRSAAALGQSKGDVMDSLHHNRKHAAVLVQVGSWKAEIDMAIAPLIREMWIAGIETSMSCQEDADGKVWIEFPDLHDLVKFLNITAQYEAGAVTLYNRMNYLLPLSDPSLAWDYGLFPADASLVWPDANDSDGPFGYEEPPDFYFTFYVRFPVTDLFIVCERLLDHNRRSAARLQAASSV